MFANDVPFYINGHKLPTPNQPNQAKYQVVTIISFGFKKLRIFSNSQAPYLQQ
jgi:hypothetical protein